MGNEGWVKLHRKILDSNIFESPNLLKFWIWCLCKASVEKRIVRVGTKTIELQKGQFIFGRRTAAITLKMSESTVYKYLGQLEKDGMINTNRNSKFTVVTIEKWGFYQGKEVSRNRNNNNKITETHTITQQKSNRNVYTNKNVENVENVENVREEPAAPFPDDDTEGIDLWGEDDDTVIDSWEDWKKKNGDL